MKQFFGYLFFALYAVAAAVAIVADFVHIGDVSDGACVEVQPVEVEMVFVGDVMAHMPQVESACVGYERYDFGPHFAPVEPLFQGADYVVANLETTLSPRPPYGGYPAFATPSELAHDLAAAGVDFVTLANNHIVDRGAVGVLHTTAALDNAGILHSGASVPHLRQGTTHGQVVCIEGLKVALLTYTYGVNGSVPTDAQVSLLEQSRVVADIARLPHDVDLTVALVHWGHEYHRTPHASQKTASEWLLAAGVDLIVGSHPHVVQPYEEWLDADGGCFGGVYYSLGNFISNQNDRHTDYGLAARVKIRKNPNEAPTLTLSADTLYRHRYTLDGRQYFRVNPTR